MSPGAKNPSTDESTPARHGDEVKNSGSATNDESSPTLTQAQNTTTGEAAALIPESPLVSAMPQAAEQGWQPALATPSTIQKLRAATPAGLVSRAYASAEEYSEPDTRKTAAKAEKWARRAMRRAAAKDTSNSPTIPDTSFRTSFPLSPAWSAPGTATSAVTPVSNLSKGTVVSRDHSPMPAEFVFSYDKFTASARSPSTPCKHGHPQSAAGDADRPDDAVDRDMMRGTEEVGTEDNDRRSYTIVRLYAGYYLAYPSRK